MLWPAMIVAAYLIGSIPFGLIIGKARGVDVREHGSKNIGATNVGRVLGKSWGRWCFALDFLKGAIPVLVAGLLGKVINKGPSELAPAEMWLWLAVAGAAVLGHMAPVWLRFRGGKGVATSFGAMIAMWHVLTLPAIAALVVWYLVVRTTKFVSLASMTAAASVPVWYLVSAIPPSGENLGGSILHASPPLLVTSALALLVIWRHRANIGRLRRGEESKVGTERAGSSP